MSNHLVPKKHENLLRALFRSLLKWNRSTHISNSKFSIESDILPQLKTTSFEKFKSIENAEGIQSLLFTQFRKTKEANGDDIDDAFQMLKFFNDFGVTIERKYNDHILHSKPDVLQNAKYEVGQIVQHSTLGFRGVVVGWEIDLDFNIQKVDLLIDEFDINDQALIKNTVSKNHKNTINIYPCTELVLIVNEHLLRVSNPQISHYFKSFDVLKGRFVPNDDLMFRYPMDCKDFLDKSSCEDLSYTTKYLKIHDESFELDEISKYCIYNRIILSEISSTALICPSSLPLPLSSKEEENIKVINLVSSCLSTLRSCENIYELFSDILSKHEIKFDTVLTDNNDETHKITHTAAILSNTLDCIFVPMKNMEEHLKKLHRITRTVSTSATVHKVYTSTNSTVGENNKEIMFKKITFGGSKRFPANNNNDFKNVKYLSSSLDQYFVTCSADEESFEVSSAVSVFELFKASTGAIDCYNQMNYNIDNLLQYRFQSVGMTYFEELIRQPTDLVSMYSKYTPGSDSNFVAPLLTRSIDYPKVNQSDVSNQSFPRLSFEVGQVVRHSYLHYRGVILGWDQRPRGHFNRNNNQNKHLIHEINQPFYMIIPDENDIENGDGTDLEDGFCYVAQENLVVIENPNDLMISNDLITRYFPQGYESQSLRYVPTAYMQFCFPSHSTCLQQQEMHLQNNNVLPTVHVHDDDDESNIENVLLDMYSVLKYSMTKSRLDYMSLNTLKCKELLSHHSDEGSSRKGGPKSFFQNIINISRDKERNDNFNNITRDVGLEKIELNSTVGKNESQSTVLNDDASEGEVIPIVTASSGNSTVDSSYSSANNTVTVPSLQPISKKIEKLKLFKSKKKQLLQYKQSFLDDNNNSTGVTTKSKSNFFEAVSIDVKDILGLLQFASSWEEGGRLSYSLSCISSAHYSIPINRMLRHFDDELRNGHLESAYEIIEDILMIDPFFAECYTKLASLHRKKSENIHIVDKALIALTLFPCHPISALDLGYAHFKIGNKEEARKYIESALKVNPSYFRVPSILNSIIFK